MEQTRIKWPEVRIHHIAARNMVVRELAKAPKGKPFSISALARRTGLEWHTVEESVRELLGKDIGGVVSKTTPNGPDLIYVDPIACDALINAERKATEEGHPELAYGIRGLRTRHC